MGYKAFHKGMICNGKQYAENTDYEEQGARKCCQAGVMHYCDEPFDVWDYYPVVDDNGEFSEYAEVEPLAEVLENGNKRATKKLRIGAKLSFKDFIKAAVSVVIESTNPKKIKNADLSDNGGYDAQIGSSGDGAKIGSSGNYAKIGSSGDWAKINMCGMDSVGAAIGCESIAKGAIGNWIVLAEWKKRDNNTLYPACVKAGKIDGETLKADTWYKLKDGEFVEVDK